MADYKILIGTQLDTKGIDNGINKYRQSKPIEFKSKLDTSGIDKKISGYKAKKPIEINAKLNTSGIAKKIGEYKPKTPVQLRAELKTQNIDTAIRSYKAKKAIEVNIKLNHAGISKQLSSYKPKTPIKLNTKLDTSGISSQIKGYKSPNIKINAKLNQKDINSAIKSYKPTALKLNVKLNKGDINQQLKGFKPSSTVYLKAALQKGAIAEEIRNFKPSTPIRVALELDKSDIENKINAYKSKSPTEIPAKIKLNVGDINAQLTKYKLTVPINLNVKKLDTASLEERIKTYTAKSPIKVGVQLDGKSINEQIAMLPKPTTPLNIGARLDASAINADIALFKPTATLGIQPDLIIENVEEQIRAYVPKSQIRLNVRLDENSINQAAGSQNNKTAIRVNVKLDAKSINEQLKAFSTNTKIKVGVKLDKEDIKRQLDSVKTIAPIKIKLDAQSVQNQINNIRRQIESLGNIRINLGGSTAAATGGAGTTGNAGVGRGAARQAEETVRAYRELASIQDRINSKQQRVAKLDTSKNSKEILELSNQISRLNQRYQELYSTFSRDFNSTQIDNLNRKFEVLNEKLNLVNRKSADAQANLANSIRGNFAGYDSEVQLVVEKFRTLSAETPSVKAGIDKVKQALLDMRTAANDNELIEAEQRYQNELEETKLLLAEARSLERQGNYDANFASKKEAAQIRLNGLFEDGSQASRRFGKDVINLRRELEQVGNTAGVERVTKKIANLERQVKNSGLQVKTLGTRLKEQFSKYSTYLSGYMLFSYATMALRSMFEQVKLIDSAMTELKKVTDETDASYSRFLDNAASKAKEIGTTIDGLVSSTADFARLGYSFEDAQGLAEVANIYAVVGDEIEGVEQATESLISTMAAFKDATSDISNADFAMDIIDKFNEVGNNFAISSGGIGEAMKRSASSMKAANNTIDETIALITAANTVVQNPDAVGTAFKTMSMRIRGATTELEEAGLETEGMAESTAKLRQEILALSGVDIMLDQDTFKSTYQILDELAVKWKDLTDIQQASITELIAGKRQGNIVSSLMNNFDTAREALETSLKSSGSAMKEHEKWQQSLEAKLNSLKASWQALSQSFLKSNALKVLIGMLSGLVDVIEVLVKNFGILGTVIGGAGAFKFLKTIIPAVATSFKILIGHTNNLGVAATVAGRKIKRAFTGAFKEIAKSIAIMNIFKAVMDIGTWISDAVSEAGKMFESSIKRFDRISEELSSVESELTSLESELSNVESQIDTLLAKDELTFAEQEELDRLRDVSSELERQIELTKTLQKSLQKSQSDTAMMAYGTYANTTSFYSKESKEDKKEAASSLGSSIGNIVGIIAGAAAAYFTGGAILPFIGVGSAAGSLLGGIGGGIISDASYDSETTVGEVLDNMRIERQKLEKAEKEAYDTYVNNGRAEKDKEAWLEAAAALSDYDAALANHMSQLSNYYNSIDYSSLTTDKQRADYLKMGDDLDKYNIEMGVKGAKKTALDRIFSDELITEEAEKLKQEIEIALNSGESINFTNFNSKEFEETRKRLAEMGITLTEVIAYFGDLKEAQLETSNYDTYDMVSNIAALSDGVTKLTDAFKEFSEQGVVSAQTLVELNEVFGNSGDAWKNYVDVMTNGISSIEDARSVTEELAEEHLDNIFKNGGIKFKKRNLITGKYEYDEDGYLTYLSTINELEYLGVENAKEYVDALQQKSMIEEAAAQMRLDTAEKEALLAKETLTKKEQARLDILKAKDIDDYISDVEDIYGIRIQNTKLIQKQYDLEEQREKLKEYDKYLSELENTINPEKYLETVEKQKQDLEIYNGLVMEYREMYDRLANPDTIGESFGGLWEGIMDMFGSDNTAFDKLDEKQKEVDVALQNYESHAKDRAKMFYDLFNIADELDIDISDIDVESFNAETADGLQIFNNLYDRVYSNINSAREQLVEDMEKMELEIQLELDNLGLEISFGRNFNKIAIDGLKSKLEQIGAAISESISGIGLSVDSIEAIEDIFGDLSSFDASKLFENTANGVRLNRTELGKLNDEFKKSNIDSAKSKMSLLKEQYEKTRDSLHNCAIGTDEYNAAIRDLSAIEAQIAASEELISQYNGVFSAYQQWQRMESSGQERDMYEGLIQGLEGIDDEISRGWMDDGTIEFLELLTGKELSTAPIDDLISAYDSLKKKIGDSKYSIRDFFTVDEEGNSTNAGVYNFLEAIESNIDGVIKRSEDGRIIGFDFEVAGGNEAIAKVLGISEELVEIMVRAADDAGFVVDVDGAVTQISYLKEQAEAAIKSLTLLKNDGLKELQGIDIDFTLDAEGGTLLYQQEQAIKLLEKFKKNGKIDFSMEGAQEALDIAKYLTIRLDDLTQPRYMELDTSSVEEGLREPIERMQEFEKLSNQKHLLTLTGDTDSLKEVESEMEEIAKELEALDDETKLKLGIDTNWTLDQITEALENGEIEIPAQVELDIQMSDDLKDMRLMMMRQLGLVSDAEVKLKIKYDVDDSVVNSLTDDEKKVVIKYIVKNEELFNSLTKEEQEIVVKYVAKDKDLSQLTQEEQSVLIKFIGDDSELESWTFEQKEAMVKYIVDGGDVEGWTPEEKYAFAKYLVDDGYINGWSPEEKRAFVKYLVDGGNVEGWTPEAKNAFVKYLVDGGDPANFDPENKETWVVYKADTTEPEEYKPTPKWLQVTTNLDNSEAENYQPTSKTMTIWTRVKNAFWGDDEGGDSGVNGTAHANGTSGRAFKQGDWRTKKTENALVGELGREIVVTPNNKWYTVGDNGAEFVNVPRGSIVFNHRQTEELLENGKATSGGGRAKALVSGTAFAVGSLGGGGGLKKTNKKNLSKTTTTTTTKTTTTTTTDDPSAATGNQGGVEKVGGSGDNSGSGGGSEKDEAEETFDWIETAIDRIEREIDSLDKKANNVYKSWSDRNSALSQELTEVGKEIELQQNAYDEYMQKANDVGLSEEWAEKVRNGEVDISTITDEDLASKIKEYQDWYNKALDCQDAVEDLKEKESELYSQRFENIQAKYDGILQGYEHTEAMLNEYITQAETKGHIVSKDYYKSLIDNEASNIEDLKNQREELIAARDQAVADGKIVEGSEEWYNMCAAIDDVTQSIAEGESAITEYGKSMRELDWEVFDLKQQGISDVVAESNFGINLMSNKDMYGDKGNLTAQGAATLGLHGLNHNTYMYQADEYANEIAKIDAQIASGELDGNSKDVINRRRELVEAQRESILAAEDEKQAIKDLVQEGIDKELDSLQELIDKKNEALQSEKDLYEYQKKVKEQTKEIASLEKQMAAYENDDSEEAKAKIQELKVSLEDAKENLKETEWDKYIQDTSALLDTLYDEYELILNTRLDNIDDLLGQVVSGINASMGEGGTIDSALGSEGAIATAIANTVSENGGMKTILNTELGSVGTTLSNSMNRIWTTEGTGTNSVLATYGSGFQNKQTTTNETLSGIKSGIDKMVRDSDKEAGSNVGSNGTSSSSKKDPTVSGGSGGSGGNSSGGSSGGDGKPKVGDKVKFVDGKYYYDSQGTNPVGSKHKGEEVYITNINTKSWATHPYHISTGSKLGSGDLGWLKLNQISGYASGKQNFLDDEIAWTQEKGKEFIVRPSDGAILTPIAKGDSVLTSVASKNIWNMANSPVEFIRENLKLASAGVPNNSNVYSNYTQHIDNVVFRMDNVKNYEEMLHAMQKDKNFEKLILSMSIDRVAGKSSLAKGKSIK